MTTKQYENRAKKYMDLKNQIAELEKELAAVAADIQDNMADAEAVPAGAFSITWKKILERRFNSKAFAADHPALYDGYKEEKEVRRFIVKTA